MLVELVWRHFYVLLDTRAGHRRIGAGMRDTSGHLFAGGDNLCGAVLPAYINWSPMFF
jgi:hypothetical protein